MGKEDAYKRGYERGKDDAWWDESPLDTFINNEEESEAQTEGYYDAIKDKARFEHQAEINDKDDDEGGCFLTTACCENKGLADDCYQLEVLRRFRDRYVMTVHFDEVKVYYDVAPEIVKAVNSLPYAKTIWDDTFSQITKAVKLIEDGQEEEAFELYKALFNSLKVHCIISDTSLQLTKSSSGNVVKSSAFPFMAVILFSSMMMLSSFIPDGLSATAHAQSCGSLRTHAGRMNCHRREMQTYRNQQRFYENRARRYNRVHKGIGYALGPYKPAWNVPRYLNQGYNWYRNR